MTMKLMVQTSKKTVYIDEMADMDEEGSLISFSNDGCLLFVCLREDFMWCEKVQVTEEKP